MLVTCAGRRLTSAKISAAVSAPVVFDMPRKQAILSTLSGEIIGVAADNEHQPQARLHTSASEGLPRGTHHTTKGPIVTLRWRHAASAAVFSAPAIVPSTGDIIYAAVDGSVIALSSAGIHCLLLLLLLLLLIQCLTVSHQAAA